MYTVYLRGEAYLAASQPAEALREFDRIIAHRGIVLADPVDAFARLQRARILAAAGNTADARRAYEDLLAIWVNGDAQVPLLERAKAEYAALRQRGGAARTHAAGMADDESNMRAVSRG